MKPFKDFYYKLLEETPINISNDDKYFNEILKSMEVYDNIISDPSYKKVYTLAGNYPIDLYESVEQMDVMCYFLPTNGNNFIYGYVCYELRPDGGVITTSVYNAKKYVGLAFRVYNEYLLTKYKYVMSDKSHTERGRFFWKKIIIFNVKTHPACIWDMQTETKVIDIKNPMDMDAFYGDTPNYERYRIRIER